MSGLRAIMWLTRLDMGPSFRWAQDNAVLVGETGLESILRLEPRAGPQNVTRLTSCSGRGGATPLIVPKPFGCTRETERLAAHGASTSADAAVSERFDQLSTGAFDSTRCMISRRLPNG